MKTTITIEEKQETTTITIKQGLKTKKVKTSSPHQVKFYRAMLECLVFA